MQPAQIRRDAIEIEIVRDQLAAGVDPERATFDKAGGGLAVAPQRWSDRTVRTELLVLLAAACAPRPAPVRPPANRTVGHQAVFPSLAQLEVLCTELPGGSPELDDALTHVGETFGLTLNPHEREAWGGSGGVSGAASEVLHHPAVVKISVATYPSGLSHDGIVVGMFIRAEAVTPVAAAIREALGTPHPTLAGDAWTLGRHTVVLRHGEPPRELRCNDVPDPAPAT